MAGIYIHIPFCRKACHYCDFHFSTSLKTKEFVLGAIIKELQNRKHAFEHSVVETIYFGGGTPSMISSYELKDIISAIYSHYRVSDSPEVTLEANPEDITDASVITSWKNAGINRLSIGIQSFNDSILSWMNRSHTAEQAIASVKTAQEHGITNISVDLIYGVPHRTLAEWEKEVTTALSLKTTHLSAYCLTIEPATAFGKRAGKGESLSLPSKASASEFLALLELGEKEEMSLYEVSNFSRKGYQSKHNSNYWNTINYIGVGPGAHSFIKNKRSWNISNNILYYKGIENNTSVSEEEILSVIDSYNEYVMTGLRRREGISKSAIQNRFDINISNEFIDVIQQYEASNDLISDENSVYLTNKGLLLADRIAGELFLTHD